MSTASPSIPPSSFLEHPELPGGVEPPDQRRAPWRPWTAWVALIAGFAGALMGAVVIGVIAALFGADYADPPPAVSILATIVQDCCLIGSALLFARMSGPPRPQQFGLRRPKWLPAVGWMAVAFFGFYVFTAIWIAATGADPEEEKLPEELGVDESTLAMLAVAFLVTVMAPIGEEVFFRGYFFGALRNWKGIWPAAILTGLIFGGIHAGSADVAYLVPLGFFGFALCLLYVRTRSLYPCIVLHCINNSLAFGVSQDWSWEIAVLVVAALATIALIARLTQPLWPAGPSTRPAVATG